MASVNTNQIKKLIAEGKISESLDLLLNLIGKDSELLNSVYLLKSRWHNLKNQEMANIISSEQGNRERNLILLSVLTLLQDAEEEKIKIQSESSITNRFNNFIKNDFFFRWSFVLVILFVICVIILMFFPTIIQLYSKVVYIGLGVSTTAFVYRVLYLYLSDKGSDKQGLDEKITLEIESLKKQISSFDLKQRQEDIVKEIKEKITNELFEDYVKNTAPEVKKKNRNDGLGDYLKETQQRLRQEINSLNNKSNVNLSIAVTTTILAIGFLIYNSFIHTEAYKTWFEFLSFFLPRISLVIFIELFSYYFLVLYKSSLGEIKHYQNELTNIEIKILSLRTALLSDDEDNLKYILVELLKTERNYILKKEETTIDIEKYKSDLELNKLFLQYMPNIESLKNILLSPEDKKNKE